jgi:DNA helicase-2/ATP-dependent DNA helicase PcrA
MSDHLTDAQRKAVEHPPDGVGQLVLAGAGSGKTRVLIARCERLVAQGIDPRAILVTTFSKRAARELELRASPDLKGIAWTTLHAWGYQILERARGPLTVTPGFLAWRSFKSLAREQAHLSASQAWKIWQLISRLKAHPVPPSAWIAWFHQQQPSIAPQAHTLLLSYEKAKIKAGVVDYDDMIYASWALLCDDKRRAELIGHLRYAFIDEVQDLNPIQLALCDQIARDAQVCLVGDLAQSIYSFRYAEPASVLLFARRHRLIRYLLPENFRCSKQIVRAANQLIEKMPRVFPVFCSVPQSRQLGQITIHNATDPHEESAWLLDQIKDQLLLGYRADQIAVLCRTRAQMAHVELALIKADQPYTTLGAGFFHAHEIKQALGICELALIPEDHITCDHLELLAATPPCPLPPDWRPLLSQGRSIIQELDRHIALRRIAGWQSFHHVRERLNSLKAIRPNSKKSEAAAVLERIYALASPQSSWQTFYQWGSFFDQSEPDDRRADNLDALFDLAQGYGLEDFLTTLNQAQRSPKGGVVVGTVHRAKGLEYDQVFLPGWAQGLFPHERAPLEEERRLAYVAITRARERVWISSTSHHKTGAFLSPSQFIQELSDELAR